MSIRIAQISRIVEKKAQRISSMSQYAYVKLETKTAKQKGVEGYFLNKIKNALENINYKKLKKLLNKELSSPLAADEEKINIKTNPINEKNINVTKKAVESFIERLDPKIKIKRALREKITDCNNPQELYKLLKNELVSELLPKRNIFFNIFRGKTQDYRNEMTMKYIKMLTPKSTNPAVIKLEQELKTMGVSEVNFSNDYDYAQISKATIEKIKGMTNITLPDSITVTAILPNGYKGKNIHSNEGKNSSHIYLAPFSNFMRMKNLQAKKILLIKQSPTFKNTHPELQKRVIEELKRPCASTNSDGHILAHEIGHNFGKLNLLDKSDEETAKGLSRTATHKTFKLNLGAEIGPELFAKIVAGEKLTEKETALAMKHLKIELPSNQEARHV